MTMRSKRVIWLLNHTTLMKTEVPILLAMGYEVFIPKILPSEAGFRSGSIDYSHDKHLSLPPHVLAALNATDFNSQTWPDHVVRYMNEYFGMIFIMMMPVPVENALKKFKGAVMLRAFGLDSTQSYADVFKQFFRDSLKWIHALGNRFWFASGYEQLCEVEPKLIAGQDIFLPLAMPTDFSAYRNTWKGTDKQIVFVCPNIQIDAYYGKVYKDFKRDFGDLPHVIVGTQKVAIDDPNVLGFVSDDKLIDLLQRSAVMYYHSREPRHVHYSPVEGVEVGTPVVFYRDNLLARMIGHPISGSVETTTQARAKVFALLQGDQSAIDEIRQDQQIITELFSESHCLATWRRSFASSGLHNYLESLDIDGPTSGERQSVVYEDVPRDLLQRIGGATLPNGSLQDGLDFSSPCNPPFVEYVRGLAPSEAWGAWSDGDVVEMSFLTPLSGCFDLAITAGARAENIGTPVLVEVGDNRGWVQFSTAPWEPTTGRVRFEIFEPVYTLRIHVPFPSRPPGSGYAIGIGLVHIQTEPTTV